MKVVVGWPVKALWPNGRAHYMTKARAVKAAREEAGWAAHEAKAPIEHDADMVIPVHIVAHLPPRTRAPDRDNIVAAAKAHLDGIAAAIGIDDQHFGAPTVEISRERTSQFIIHLGKRD